MPSTVRTAAEQSPGEDFRVSEERYRILAHSAPIGIFECDAEGSVTYVNDQFVTIFGRSDEGSLGFNWAAAIHPEDRDAVLESWRQVMLEGRSWEDDFRIVRPTGVIRRVRALASPLRGGDGQATGYVGTIIDITERREAAIALRESERKFRTMFKQVGVGMSLLSTEGEILEVNPAYCSFTGYSEKELLGASIDRVIFAEDRDLAWRMFRRTQAEPGVPAVYEQRFLRLDGTVIWGLVSIVWIFANDGRVAYGIGLVQDITLRKEAEAKLDHLAYHDLLTGLPNRRLMHDRLEHALAKAKRSGSLSAVLFIDLDGFKYINDSHGHPTGDQVLCEVAGSLKEGVREADTLARFGGDEFVLILEDVPDTRGVAQTAQKVLDTLAQPISADGLQFHLTASVGISIFPFNGDSADALIRCADAAMYRAKESGRNSYKFYSAEANARIRRMLQMETDLRRALEEDQLLLHYQPQFNLATRELAGFEALLRWRHPEEGLLLPGKFIPIAEETGLIVPIGRWVLEQACRQAKTWEGCGLALRMAVNISAIQFRGGQLAGQVREVLEQTGLDPGRLELELTESMVMEDVQRTIRTMQEIASLGVHLAIDDFGLGYSSLSYLRRFPISRLKIDRSFISEVTSDRNSATLTNAVIALAKTMSLEVVAEGIEMEEQAEFLRASGCEFSQGFLFCQPLSVSELEEKYRH